MPGGVRVHLYCLCWNDARMLPYFFRHYDDIVDQYVVYDNGSTDGSLEMLASHGRVQVRHFDVAGNSFVEEQCRLSDTIWQDSRGKADWVIVTDIDEHIYRPDLLAYLDQCQAEGVTAIQSLGYEMVADVFPSGPEKLTCLITRGCRSAGHDRLCIFNPDAITATRFGPGRHKAWPEGHVVWPASPEVLLLHYKQLGVKYVRLRSAELAAGIRSGDVEKGWGTHYQWTPEQIVENWAKLKADARPVPGLGELSHVPPEEYRGDEKIIAESGLLDGDWYLATNRDLLQSAVDPLVHYCRYGWREGRMPNFYFDPLWYATNYPQAIAGGANPLVHYVLRGEAADEMPSERFDTGWYRREHRLGPEESPLRHYLLRRGSGKVKPLPDFDLEQFLKAHPAVQAAGRDPFEEHSRRAAAPFVVQGDAPLPDIAAVLKCLDLDLAMGVFPANVSWEALSDVIRLFLAQYPLDEAWYRATYADVDAAIRNGEVDSALSHFITYGFFEGRKFRPPTIQRSRENRPAAPVRAVAGRGRS